MEKSVTKGSAKEATQKAAKKTTATAKSSKVFTDVEREAMRERAREIKSGSKKDGESDLLAKIAAMTEPDRAMGKKIHEIVTKSAPELTPTTWYGMPAYSKEGKVVCFFQAAAKFKARYATFGFNEAANLDDGNFWPTAYALTKLTAADEKAIAALVKRAVS